MYILIYTKAASWFKTFGPSSTAGQIPYSMVNLLFSTCYVFDYMIVIFSLDRLGIVDLSRASYVPTGPYAVAAVMLLSNALHYLYLDRPLDKKNPDCELDSHVFGTKESFYLGGLVLSPILLLLASLILIAAFE